MRIIGMFALVFVMSYQAAVGGELALTTAGKTEYVIVVPTEATPVEQTAAKEFQEHLAQVTGATLSIIVEKDVPAGTPLLSWGPASV